MTTSLPTDPETLSTRWVGSRRRVFWLTLSVAVWTLLTLGFYRFWGKTRMRRWYWSSVQPGGHPLEYVGHPLEKLLGFLIAVVIMAFYLGIVNLILMFLSFSLLAAPTGGYLASFIGVIPVLFYAQYRSRRYVLARTRWRGVRFGLEPGAWPYAWLAAKHWIATIVTLGAWWPRKTFALEKFKTDRTFFGDARLHQGGDWRDLYPAFAHVIVAAILSAGAVGLMLSGETGLWPVLAGTGLWFLGGILHFMGFATRYLTSQKRLKVDAELEIALASALRVPRVQRIYVLGYSIAGVLAFLPLIVLGIGIGIMLVVMGEPMVEDMVDAQFANIPPVVTALFGIATYLFMMLMWTVLRHTFVTMPLWKHLAETLTVEQADVLARVGQRERDEFGEAEGFAEALDVGAAL